eukprot:jgi/Tetstr1/447160/TSEL_034597.t1
MKEYNQSDTEEMKTKQESHARMIQGKLHVDMHRLSKELESLRMQTKIEELSTEIELVKYEMAEKAKRRAEAEFKTAAMEQEVSLIRDKVAALR